MSSKPLEVRVPITELNRCHYPLMTYLKFAYRTLCTNPEAIIWPTIISVTYLRVASMDKVIVYKFCDKLSLFVQCAHLDWQIGVISKN